MDRKIYHLEFKDSFFNFYYGDLTLLFNTWGECLKISKSYLEKWDFDKPFENDVCIIRKDKLYISTRSRKKVLTCRS